jgi:hypothetical protein
MFPPDLKVINQEAQHYLVQQTQNTRILACKGL